MITQFDYTRNNHQFVPEGSSMRMIHIPGSTSNVDNHIFDTNRMDLNDITPLLYLVIGLFQKKFKQRGLRIYLFIFLLYPWKFHSYKTKLNPWKFHKIVLDPLKIPGPKTKTPGNCTLFFQCYCTFIPP